MDEPIGVGVAHRISMLYVLQFKANDRIVGCLNARKYPVQAQAYTAALHVSAVVGEIIDNAIARNLEGLHHALNERIARHAS